MNTVSKKYLLLYKLKGKKKLSIFFSSYFHFICFDYLNDVNGSPLATADSETWWGGF